MPDGNNVRVHATVPATRNGYDIELLLTQDDDGRVKLHIPAVRKLSSANLEIDAEDMGLALARLTPPGVDYDWRTSDG